MEDRDSWAGKRGQVERKKINGMETWVTWSVLHRTKHDLLKAKMLAKKQIIIISNVAHLRKNIIYPGIKFNFKLYIYNLISLM